MLSVGDGLVIIGDGGGGLHEGLVDGGCFAVGNVLLWFLFEFRAELGDEVLFFHCLLTFNNYILGLIYYTFDYNLDLLRNNTIYFLTIYRITWWAYKIASVNFKTFTYLNTTPLDLSTPYISQRSRSQKDIKQETMNNTLDIR